jgi:hypothetical protein
LSFDRLFSELSKEVTVKYTPSKGFVYDFIPYRSIISDSSCHEGERKGESHLVMKNKGRGGGDIPESTRI